MRRGKLVWISSVVISRISTWWDAFEHDGVHVIISKADSFLPGIHFVYWFSFSLNHFGGYFGLGEILVGIKTSVVKIHISEYLSTSLSLSFYFAFLLLCIAFLLNQQINLKLLQKNSNVEWITCFITILHNTNTSVFCWTQV